MNAPRTWFKGNEVEYTAKYDIIHGGLFYEVVTISGLNRGEVFWIVEAPKTDIVEVVSSETAYGRTVGYPFALKVF